MAARTILVVDDEPKLREIISMVLGSAGHHVVEAGDGLAASKALKERTFDVVITDVIMPERDGMQVIGEVRRRYPSIKIIAMSGGGHVSREQYLKIAKGLGAHAALEKPFRIDELVKTVESLTAEAV